MNLEVIPGRLAPRSHDYAYVNHTNISTNHVMASYATGHLHLQPGLQLLDNTPKGEWEALEMRLNSQPQDCCEYSILIMSNCPPSS